MAAVPGHCWHCDFQRLEPRFVHQSQQNIFPDTAGRRASSYIAPVTKEKLTHKHFAVNSQFNLGLGLCLRAYVTGLRVGLFCDKCCL